MDPFERERERRRPPRRRFFPPGGEEATPSLALEGAMGENRNGGLREEGRGDREEYQE